MTGGQPWAVQAALWVAAGGGCCGLGRRAKSSIEVTKCSSNILVWFGRDAPEKSVAGTKYVYVRTLWLRGSEKALFLVLFKICKRTRKVR